MSTALDVISGAVIAVGALAAAYHLSLLMGRSAHRLTPARQRLASRNFGFSLFVICLGLLFLLDQRWPNGLRWSINAVAAVLVLSNLGWLIKEHVQRPERARRS